MVSSSSGTQKNKRCLKKGRLVPGSQRLGDAFCGSEEAGEARLPAGGAELGAGHLLMSPAAFAIWITRTTGRKRAVKETTETLVAGELGERLGVREIIDARLADAG
jgi:hypothetical protein